MNTCDRDYFFPLYRQTYSTGLSIIVKLSAKHKDSMTFFVFTDINFVLRFPMIIRFAFIKLRFQMQTHTIDNELTILDNFIKITFLFSKSDVPMKSGRFLGDASGLAEFVNDSVIYCRHDNCWKLNILANQWDKVKEEWIYTFMES